MGCDIHMIAQIKTDGAWKTLAPVNINRNYVLFSLLADVRNTGDIMPIDCARGLPGDLNSTIDPDAYDDFSEHIDGHWLGDHSISWLSYSELLAVDLTQSINRYANPTSLDDACGHLWTQLADIFKDVNPEDCRVVFGFDS